jgi:hypothetical protein
MRVQNFIYVFDKEARDTLLGLKYDLLKHDEVKDIYIFVNEDRGKFTFANISYVISDTLTF